MFTYYFFKSDNLTFKDAKLPIAGWCEEKEFIQAVLLVCFIPFVSFLYDSDLKMC